MPSRSPDGTSVQTIADIVGAMTERITRVESTPTQLLIHFSDGLPLALSWLWVRDHSQDDTSFDLATQQRSVDTFSLSLDHPAGTARLEGSAVHIEWPHGEPDSILPISLLESVSGRVPAAPKTLWRSPEKISLTPVPYDAIVETTAGLDAWLSDIDRFGAGLVSGAPGDMSAVDALTKRIGYVRHTIFGGTWTLSSDVTAHADSAYGADTLEPHTDGSYSHDGPGMQMFVCSERTGDGGESVLVDGFAAAEALRESDPGSFQLLCDVEVPAHYVEDGVSLSARRPTFRLDDHGNLVQVTFNNYDRSPFVLEPTKMQAWYRAYAAFHAVISDRSTWWMHRLEPGDALIFDNWRCLHGRMAYNGVRVFNGTYLNHEDLESALRLTQHSLAAG